MGSTRNILLARSTCMCHGLREWWNIRGKNMDLLLMWHPWDSQNASCIGDGLSDMKTWRPLEVITTHRPFSGSSLGTQTPTSDLRTWWWRASVLKDCPSFLASLTFLFSWTLLYFANSFPRNVNVGFLFFVVVVIRYDLLPRVPAEW